ncbi:MAG: hypothetical protein K2K97_02660, partial [Muribaculaceae bacterium]|nr:hypothetical protein [Muribaculaceae bacterium]
MTYIDLINRFWKLHREWEFSSVETKLYFLLLDIANSLAWKCPFQLGNDRLFINFEEAPNTVRRARLRLAKAGLIAIDVSKKKSERSKYYICGID